MEGFPNVIKTKNSKQQTKYKGVYTVIKEDGTRSRNKTGMFDTPQQAQAEARRRENDAVRNLDSKRKEQRELTLEDVLNKFIDYTLKLPLRDISATTRRMNVSRMKAIITLTDKSLLKMKWDRFGKYEFDEFLDNIIYTDRGYTLNYLRNLKATISQFVKFLGTRSGLMYGRKDDIDAFKYTLKSNKLNTPDVGSKPFLTEEQFIKLINSMLRKTFTSQDYIPMFDYLSTGNTKQLEHIQYSSKTKRFMTYYTLFTVYFYTGMRTEEIRPLLWSDIDFENGLIKITKAITGNVLKQDKKKYRDEFANPKNKNAKRNIGMLPPVVDVLTKYKLFIEHMTQSPIDSLASEFMLVFPSNKTNSYLSDNAIDSMLNKSLKDAGLHHISKHGFRHSFAHYLCEVLDVDYEDACVHFGHSDSKMLKAVYNRRNGEENYLRIKKKIERAYNYSNRTSLSSPLIKPLAKAPTDFLDNLYNEQTRRDEKYDAPENPYDNLDYDFGDNY